MRLTSRSLAGSDITRSVAASASASASASGASSTQTQHSSISWITFALIVGNILTAVDATCNISTNFDGTNYSGRKEGTDGRSTVLPGGLLPGGLLLR